MLCQILDRLEFAKFKEQEVFIQCEEVIDEDMNHLACAPDNVISHVLNYLTTPSDLFHAMCTCRRWKDLALDPQLWSEARKAQWSQIEAAPKPPPPMGGHSAIQYNGKIYIIAGAGDRLFSKKVYTLDAETMRWEKILPTKGAEPPLTYHHSANMINGTVYIWGGVNFTNTVYSLNLDSITWTQHQPTGEVPPVRHHHCAAAYGTKIYVLGGQTANHSSFIPYDHASVLDTVTMNWEKVNLRGGKDGIPLPMRGSSAVIFGKKIFVFGGLDEKQKPSSDLWELNLDTMAWSKIHMPGQPPKARYAHSCTIISNEEFICYGGYDGVCDLDALTVFNIKTGRCWDPVSIPTEPAPHYRTATTITWVGNRCLVFGGLYYVHSKINSFNDVFSLVLRSPKPTGH